MLWQNNGDNMKSILTIILGLVAITSCTRCAKQEIKPRPSHSLLNKTGVLIKDRMESQPIVFKDALYYIVSNRFASLGLEIYNQDLELLATHETGTDLVSAIVVNDNLYVFAAKERKSIVMIKTKDFAQWSEPIEVLRAPQGHNYFNSSVTKTNIGYLMAYETCEPNTECFNIRFAESTNLIDWHEVGKIYSPNAYAACPTIRYLNGTYYMFYLVTVDYKGLDYYDTVLVKSSDLVNWSKPITVLQAEGSEDRNNSDFDFVEFNGQIYGNYADGDQHGGQTNIRGINFQGTEQEMYNYLSNTMQ